jgi:phytoene desaturase
MNTGAARRASMPALTVSAELQGRHIVVVGAGIGGLAAAIGAAASGARVTVLEAHAQAGGKAGIAVVDGVEFDTGPSVVTLLAELDAVFAQAGVRLEDFVTPLESDTPFRYIYPSTGAVVDIYADWERSRESIERALGGPAAAQADEFVSYCGRIWAAAEKHFISGPQPNLARMGWLTLRHPAAVMAIDSMRTMKQAIDACVQDPHLRDLFYRYATYNGSDVRRAPATLNCIAFVELGLGGYGIEGGLYVLIRAMHAVAAELGVDFRFGARADRIVVESGQARAVVVGAEQLACDAVVVNADSAHLFTKLLGRPEPKKLDASMSGWTAVVRARRRSERPAHCVLFAEDYVQEFVDIFDGDIPPSTPTVYLCAQEKAHHRTGWAQHEPLFVMANAPAEPVGARTDDAIWADLRTRVMDRIVKAGLVDADDEVVWERTPGMLAAEFPDSRGSIYGAASNDKFAAFRRTGNRVDGVRGVYAASGSAHPGGGVPLCARSGVAVAELLREDVGARR